MVNRQLTRKLLTHGLASMELYHREEKMLIKRNCGSLRECWRLYMRNRPCRVISITNYIGRWFVTLRLPKPDAQLKLNFGGDNGY
jgi:hypothetical protein